MSFFKRLWHILWHIFHICFASFIIHRFQARFYDFFCYPTFFPLSKTFDSMILFTYTHISLWLLLCGYFPFLSSDEAGLRRLLLFCMSRHLTLHVFVGAVEFLNT